MAGPFALAVGGQVTAPLDAQAAIEPGRCRHRERDCARSTSSRSCGRVGGQATEREAAASVLRFRRQRTGFAASMTDRSSLVRGLEAATRPAAAAASTVVLALPLRKHGIGRGKDYGF